MQPKLPQWRAQGAEVLLVCQEEERVSQFLRQRNLDITALLDTGEAGRAYSVMAIPKTIWVDKEGKIRDESVGWRPEKLVEFDNLVANLSR